MWQELKSLPVGFRVALLFIILVLVGVIFAWYSPTEVNLSGTFTPAPPIASVADVTKEDIKLAKAIVKALPKEKVVKKLKLPPEIAADPNKQITATADVPCSPKGANVIAVIDTVTGETTISSKPKPVPFFEFENKRRIGVGYALASSDMTAGKIFGEWSFLRVASAHVGVQGEVTATSNSKPDARIFATIDYRW